MSHKRTHSPAAANGGASDLKRSRFDPVSLGLPPEFQLTDYTRLKGCSCKLPQPKLLALLQEVSTSPGQEDVGMDCSIVPVHHKNEKGEALFLVSTTDFFFPSVADPFLQGQIGAANVLSDLYSMGIADCDTMLMLLAASTDMDEHERLVTTREIMKGFAERAQLATTSVTGGQTVMNPWPLIGGVAMAVVSEAEMVRPAGLLRAGDVLVLTKPLGCQIAMNLKQWLMRPSPLYEEAIEGRIAREDIEELYNKATDSMRRLNRAGARLMLKHGAHGATDVTGFGILGHANNFGAAQAVGESPRSLCLVLERLPMLKTAVVASRLMKDKYRLFEGYSAETSGGLLVALPNLAVAEAFQKELHDVDGGCPAWIVGHVEERAATAPDGVYARLKDGYEIVEV
ncbi:putative selenophosphate synthetase [Leptomonas pyrrhocoris]|uniref:Putative selenophosphate synthetase n=1 Tax=Leptomonas pyrrhocoris TaxID=157538 RepID=A0A0N0DWC8_LEPPY|nr:putative selenophosphate synthetase [Leptomonas pyrrhocoris]KPA81634.1 putative selenophosphate synthetase [Leptomonas pyrrhocoris]|eukprot:XP_015660073.1 putative selenophosphate synthetase [Leptomonas pyrrhocoris]